MADSQTIYNQIAGSFSRTRRNPWKEFVLFRRYLKSGDAMLDLGCGNGRLFDFLSQYAEVEYTGLDVAEELLDEAKKMYPDGKFLFGDMRKRLPFDDNSFDHVWAIASFHHLATVDEREFCLREIQRVLKKDGVLVIMVWNLFQKKYLPLVMLGIIQRLLGKSKAWNDVFVPWKAEANVEDKKNVFRYYHAFYPQELRGLLKKNGFEIVEEMCTKKGEKVKFRKSFNLCFVSKMK